MRPRSPHQQMAANSWQLVVINILEVVHIMFTLRPIAGQIGRSRRISTPSTSVHHQSLLLRTGAGSLRFLMDFIHLQMAEQIGRIIALVHGERVVIQLLHQRTEASWLERMGATVYLPRQMVEQIGPSMTSPSTWIFVQLLRRLTEASWSRLVRAKLIPPRIVEQLGMREILIAIGHRSPHQPMAASLSRL